VCAVEITLEDLRFASPMAAQAGNLVLNELFAPRRVALLHLLRLRLCER
jgi:hypothetical protein